MKKTRLEKGMFIKTTYGVAKIERAYIIYTDDGYLWHLTYMTNNPEIEVAIYTEDESLKNIKLKNDSTKYEDIENNLELIDKIYSSDFEYVCYVPVNNNYPRNASLFDDHVFLNASFDASDLIDINDIVELTVINEDGSDGTGMITTINRAETLMELKELRKRAKQRKIVRIEPSNVFKKKNPMLWNPDKI